MAAGGDSAARLLNRLWYSSHPACGLLWPFSAVIAFLVAVRRRCYAAGLMRSHRVDACVVVVGNLTVGGTGKTPVTLWLAQSLAAHGVAVGIVTNGYGGTGRNEARLVSPDSDPAVVGDEAVLAAKHTGCPVAAGRDRAEAARLLVRETGVEIVIADDGLQHLRLERDFEIVVVDGRRGFGNGLCLPFGPLREPARRLRTVDAVIVNGGSSRIEGALTCSVAPAAVVEMASGATRSLDALRGQTVHAVAALGNPERFFASLEAAGIRVDRHAHRDHRQLSWSDLTFDDHWPVLITAKDAVKLPLAAPANVWVVEAIVRFDDRERAAFLVTSILGGCMRKKSHD